MKRKLAVLFVFAALWSMLGVAAEENQDLNYLRLRSGRYTYSIQHTISSNYVRGFVGGRIHLDCELTLNNTTNISVHVDKIYSLSSAGIVGAEKEIELENKQLPGTTGVFNINSKTRSLELVKNNNKVADCFFGQIGYLLAVPLPTTLYDGMSWTNSASSCFMLQKQILTGHNGSNCTFCITGSANNDDVEEEISEYPTIDVYMIIDKRAEQITLATCTMRLGEIQATKGILKYIGTAKDTKRE